MRIVSSTFLLALSACLGAAAPVLLDSQFELPRGFHIYRAAGPELTGGSYDITFDGEGRLLAGDGNAVRRLKDANGDGVFDGFDVIASGLGSRGPQGLLVYGERLYAVGGDGIQLYEGYKSGGALQHKGRIGNKFLTGGDHDAHTIFRGHDGYLYFMAGNGAGIAHRAHITESSSPALAEREASVFRISPDGAKWECLACGGRNPPNLGMNYLGDLFSFDSDMEWHVGLPWYRPVRLNHWIMGGDQGWQEVGAYPPYYIDCLPGILDVGRGSPTWGVFYEHTQFPAKFRNAYLVCDYRWKRESNDQYATSGRLVTFFLQRKGASWSAEMQTLARPKPGARDEHGKPISFALVDVDVAPDGSIFVSDHNQGVWRIFFGERRPPEVLSLSNQGEPLRQLLALPQPGAEWSRVREEAIRREGGAELESQLRALATNGRKPLDERLRAIRLLWPSFADLAPGFLEILARDGVPEIRGQAAALLSLQGRSESVPLLCQLLRDADPFVRWRAAEALERFGSPDATDALIERLSDSSRAIRYTAMIALAHASTDLFFAKAAGKRNPQTRMRALVAASLRHQLPSTEEILRVISSLLEQPLFPEDRLDFLRVLEMFRKQISQDAALTERLRRQLVEDFPAATRKIRWEQIRLLGDYEVNAAFPKLIRALEAERDQVTQFHIAQALARLKGGWTAAEEERLLKWIATTQRGWFADFASKGVEFPQFWVTTLTELAANHRVAFLQKMSQIDFANLLGTVVINLLGDETHGSQRLIGFYETHPDAQVRLKVLNALARFSDAETLRFCRAAYAAPNAPELKNAALKTLAGQSKDSSDAVLFFGGLANRQVEVVRACAAALSRIKPPLSEEHARAAIGRLNEGGELFRIFDSMLIRLSGQNPPALARPLTDAQRTARIQYWRGWYEKQFGKSFDPAAVASNEKSNDQLLNFLLSNDAKGGSPLRGGEVYERLQCHTCHGGGVNPGREGGLFGPDLAGVTRRLSPKEFAEALVFPSKQVADRYKAYEITLKNGMILSGFITEQTDLAVTIATRDQVHRLGRADISSLQPQAASLMPEHLLNALSWDEIKDLFAFLDAAPAPARQRP